jgi:hypothetical protein
LGQAVKIVALPKVVRMSVSYFITALDPQVWRYLDEVSLKATSDLSIDPETYKQELLSRWSDAEVWTFKGSLMLLEWTLYHTGMDGNLHPDKQTVAFRAGKGLVEYVLWHRAVISPTYTLYLWAENSWGKALDLHIDTTAEEVVNFLEFNM